MDYDHKGLGQHINVPDDLFWRQGQCPALRAANTAAKALQSTLRSEGLDCSLPQCYSNVIGQG